MALSVKAIQQLLYYLASSNTRHILAAAVLLSAGDHYIAPSPVGTRSAATDNGNVVSTGNDTTASRNVLQHKVGDGDAACWASMKITTIVVLLNEDSVAVKTYQKKLQRSLFHCFISLI